jgi:hypothetical protein
MLEIRTKTIAELFRLPHSWLNCFERSTKTVRIGADETEACHALIYGSLARGLQKANLWPLKSSDDIYLSINKMAILLMSIRFFFMTEPRGKDFNASHSSFDTLSSRVGVARVLEDVGSPVMDCHIVHMKAQRGEEN